MAKEPEEVRPEFEDEGGPVKSFLDHLEDLRWVLIKSGAALVLGMITCLVGSNRIVEILKWPLKRSGIKSNLDTLGPLGGMKIAVDIALYGGIALAVPFILYFVGQFILPALKRHEKKYFLRAFIVGGGLFFAGAGLCYFVILDITLNGIAQFNEWMNLPSDLWRAEEYFSFVIMFMLGMGVSFEIPVVLLTLVKVGIIPHEWFMKGRRYFFVANLVICSFITPDFLSTFFIVIPVQILMEICILISKSWDKQKKAAEAAARAQSLSDLPLD
jgi:sec-independent protein translocase protein TatC